MLIKFDIKELNIFLKVYKINDINKIILKHEIYIRSLI